jgi:hypothetical protein
MEKNDPLQSNEYNIDRSWIIKQYTQCEIFYIKICRI